MKPYRTLTRRIGVLSTGLALATLVLAGGCREIHHGPRTFRHASTDKARVVVDGPPVLIKAGEKLDGNLVVVGGRAVVHGEVTGSVVVIGGHLDVGPNAKVHEDLVTVGSHFKGADSSQVSGSRILINHAGVRWMVGNVRYAMNHLAVTIIVGSVGLLVLLILGFWLTIRPYDARRFRGTVTHRPVRAGLIGLLLLAGLHVLMIAAFASRYGIGLVAPLWFAQLALGVVGWIAVAGHVGQRIGQARGWTVGPFVAGLAGVGLGGLVFLIPVAGQVAAALAACVGAGALIAPSTLDALPTEPTEPTEPAPPVASAPLSAPAAEPA